MKKIKKTLGKIGEGYSKLGRNVLNLGSKAYKNYKYKQSSEYKKELIKKYKIEAELAKVQRKAEKEKKKLEESKGNKWGIGNINNTFGY